MGTATRMSALDKLSKESREQLERQARDICGLFSKEPIVFELKGPDKLTVLTRGGQYTKLPFIGEEKFSGASAYVGKSAKVIVQLSQIDTTSGDLIEIPLLEMMPKMDGFSAFTRRLSEYQDALVMDSARAEADEIEKMAHEQAARATTSTNPAFGSW